MRLENVTKLPGTLKNIKYLTRLVACFRGLSIFYRVPCNEPFKRIKHTHIYTSISL